MCPADCTEGNNLQVKPESLIDHRDEGLQSPRVKLRIRIPIPPESGLLCPASQVSDTLKVGDQRLGARGARPLELEESCRPEREGSRLAPAPPLTVPHQWWLRRTGRSIPCTPWTRVAHREHPCQTWD